MNDTCENCGAVLTHAPVPVADGGFDRPCHYCGAPNHEAPPASAQPRPPAPPEQPPAPAETRAPYGYLSVSAGQTRVAPDLTHLHLYLDVAKGATLQAPFLAEVESYVSVDANARLDAPLLVKIGGYLTLGEGATLNAPLLSTVALYVQVPDGAEVNAPLLRGFRRPRGGAVVDPRRVNGWRRHVPKAILPVLGVLVLLSPKTCTAIGLSDETRSALDVVHRCPRAMALIGDDPEPSWVGCMNGESKSGCNSGSGSWSLPVSGSRSRGTLELSYTQRANQPLRFGSLTLDVGDRRVDVLQCKELPPE